MLTTIERRAALLAEAGRRRRAGAAVRPRRSPAGRPEEFVDRVLVDGAARRGRGGRRELPLRQPGRGRRRDARRGRRASAASTSRRSPLDGGPQVWSSTYVRTCLAAGDVAGAAEALGRPYAVRGVVVQRRPARPRARLPDGQRAHHGDGRGPGRRRLRRLAAPARHRRDRVPGRDQRRHQPDLRRACASAGSRPTCSTATTSSCTAWRSRSRSSTGCAGMVRFEGVDELVETMHDDVPAPGELLG